MSRTYISFDDDWHLYAAKNLTLAAMRYECTALLACAIQGAALIFLLRLHQRISGTQTYCPFGIQARFQSPIEWQDRH
ncbi:MAG: hypothetical protein IPP59_11370 [Betaproteobacteria bacterium]|nr:hypothetical protein [Candidatus Dechloromonas phosphorivorans]